MKKRVQCKGDPRKRLVDTLEGRDGLALVLVEGGVDDPAVGEVDVG